MENFITWLADSFLSLITALVFESTQMINNVIENGTGLSTFDYDINLVLFSDTPILTTNLYDLIGIFFGIFYTLIFIIIFYKIIKKVLVKITGWKKW